MRVTNRCDAVGNGWGELLTDSREKSVMAGALTFTHGCVITENGIVWVHSRKEESLSGKGKAHEETVLRFAVRGYCFVREYPAFHKEKYLITLAKRFAAEMKWGK